MKLSTVAAFAILGGSLYALYRFLGPKEATLDPTVRRRLPLAKNLNTIEDVSGNYDIDGVSFDTNGVVVSGDGNKVHHVAPPATSIDTTTSEQQIH